MESLPACKAHWTAPQAFFLGRILVDTHCLSTSIACTGPLRPQFISDTENDIVFQLKTQESVLVSGSVPRGSAFHSLYALESAAILSLQAEWVATEESLLAAINVQLDLGALKILGTGQLPGVWSPVPFSLALASVVHLLCAERLSEHGSKTPYARVVHLEPREPCPRIQLSAEGSWGFYGLPEDTGITAEGTDGVASGGLQDAIFEAIAPADWVEEAAPPAGVLCVLHRYQKRALSWAIWRETAAGSGAVGSPLRLVISAPGGASLSYFPAEGHLCPAERGGGAGDPGSAALPQVRGGVLSDEMGLGKTVEVISLLLSRPPPAGPWDCQDSGHAEARAGTLIVTPQPLLRQWRAELSNHSPQLKVTEYHGLKHLSEALSQAMSSKRPRKNQGLDLDEFARETAAVMENNLPELSRLMIERFARADVVLTTYPVFTDEVHYASPSGDAGRKLRHEKKFPVPQSPLLRVLWWRTVMDEAQMAGSQISSVARMAQRLRSVHSWAVTGTPIGPRGEDDLVDLLRLLRVDTAPWREALAVFRRGFPWSKQILRQAFAPIMWRNSKALVADELKLPPRSLSTVWLSFSPVERTFYEHVLANTRKAARRLRDEEEHTCGPAGSQRPGGGPPGSDPPGAPLGKRRRRSGAEHHRRMTKKAVKLEKSAWHEMTQLRLACIHPQITSYWKKLSSDLQLQDGGALSLAEIHETLVRKAQVELQAKEREVCALLNLLAEKLLQQAQGAAAGKRRRSSEGGKAAQGGPSPPAAGQSRDDAEGSAPPPSLERGGGGPEDLEAQAIEALEMSYRIAENGIAAAYQSTEGLEKVSIDSDVAAWKAWRLIQVHTARLLSELYGRAGNGPRRAAMLGKLEKDKADLLESVSGSMADIRAKVAALESELESESVKLHRLTQAAALAGVPIAVMGAEASDWLEDLGTAVCGAKARERVQREDQARLAEEGAAHTQALLGTIVFDCLRSFEADPRPMISARLGEVLLHGLAAEARRARAALQAPRTSAPVDGSTLAQPAARSILWAVLSGRDGVRATQQLAPRLTTHELAEAAATLLAAERAFERNHRRHTGKLEGETRELLRGVSARGCMEAISAFSCRANILRLHRELHTAEVQLEVAQHNEAQTTEEVESAASGSSSLPMGMRGKKTEDIRAVLFGGERLRAGQPSLMDEVQGLLAKKRYLENQLKEDEGQRTPPLNGQHTLSQDVSASPTEDVKPQVIFETKFAPETARNLLPGNFCEGCAAPTGIAFALSGNPCGLLGNSTETKGPEQVSLEDILPSKQQDISNQETPQGTLVLEKPAGPIKSLTDSSQRSDDPSCRTCPTCLEPLSGVTYIFPCGHLLCKACYSSYLGSLGQKSRNLPCFYCRQRCPISQVTRVVLKSADGSRAADDASLSEIGVTGQWLTKLEALLRRLLHLQTHKPTEKSLVFSQFPEALGLLARALQANGLRYARLEAGRKGAQNSALDVFGTDPECRVFLLSLRVGGAGLTLVAANHVFLLEPSLDPGIAQQAIARVHRIGQDRPVHVTRFVVRSSVEAEVLRLQESQQALMEQDVDNELTQVVKNETADPETMRGLLETVCGSMAADEA